jgi:hypothetical protein
VGHQSKGHVLKEHIISVDGKNLIDVMGVPGVTPTLADFLCIVVLMTFTFVLVLVLVVCERGCRAKGCQQAAECAYSNSLQDLAPINS